MLGIHQRQNRIKQKALGNFIVHEKRLRYRPRIGQASGFNYHPVKVQLPLALLLCQSLKRGAQIFANGAANTAIAHLNNLLIGIRHQNVAVNILLTKLIFNDGNFLSVSFRQHALKQGGFTGTQKPSQDGCRNQSHGNTPKREVKQKSKQERSVPIYPITYQGEDGLTSHPHPASEKKLKVS